MSPRAFRIAFCILPVALLPLFHSAVAGPCREIVVLSDLIAVYPTPSDSSSPLFMARKGQRFTTCASGADDSGTIWFGVQTATRKDAGWVMAQHARYVPDSLRTEDSVLVVREKADREEAKRRYAALRKHPEWPRRIREAVRKGEVILHMTREQLIECWGPPERTGKAFLLGIGSYETMAYKSRAGQSSFISLQDGKVVGWSEQ